MLPQGGVHSFSYMPQSVTSSKELTNQQVFFFLHVVISSPIHMLKMYAYHVFYMMTMHLPYHMQLSTFTLGFVV